jgi:hypothetical protein
MRPEPGHTYWIYALSDLGLAVCAMGLDIIRFALSVPPYSCLMEPGPVGLPEGAPWAA